MNDPNLPPVLILMGVAGSGKTTIGREISRQLEWDFIDSDDLQTPAHVRKLSSGRRLSDEERFSWLLRIRSELNRLLTQARPGVIAFPGLRRSDRDVVFSGIYSRLRVVFLSASLSLLRERVRARHHAFFNPGVLDAEFSILEEPSGGVVVDAGQAPEKVVGDILTFLGPQAQHLS